MLGELPPHAGMAALGHAAGDATASAYDKATYFAERVELAERPADRLDVLEPVGRSFRCLATPRRELQRRRLIWCAVEGIHGGAR